MSLLPRDPYQRGCFLFFVCFLAASCIKPPYVDYLLMQHVPTTAAAILLVYLSNRLVISRFSFSLIIVFMCLHTLGARYLYSYTPYDVWSEMLFGVTINDLFDWDRNHYDRFVHFCFGLLLAVPIQEVERRYLKLSPGMSSLLAAECILSMSGLYEILEWIVSLVFAPDWAESFLGMQGDVFDGQKDMALAITGAVASLACSAAWKRASRRGGAS